MNTTAGTKVKLQSGDALIIVDVQNDFLPGGSLGVPRGDEIIPVINNYITQFQQQVLPIYATRDWHPEDHCSFESQGGIWPPHCIQESDGAAFAQDLQLPPDAHIMSKASQSKIDAYSGFQDTDLHQQLQRQHIVRLFIGGLATDYCVLNTVKDAIDNHYQVYLLVDAIRAVNVDPGDGDQAIQEMEEKGAISMMLNELV
jgi:nicotinamidase/pyrazinamidase